MNTTENTRPTLTIIEPSEKLPTLKQLSKLDQRNLEKVHALAMQYIDHGLSDTNEYKEVRDEARWLQRVMDARDSKPYVCFPHTNTKGEVTDHIVNIVAMYEYERVNVAFNIMAKRINVIFEDDPSLTDGCEGAIKANLRSKYITHEISSIFIDEHIAAVADKNKYHPVKDWMDTLTWDGTSRLGEFYNIFTFQADADINLMHAYMRKWLIQGVAAIYRPDYRLQGILTLQGAQGTRKSSLLKTLTPNIDWIRTDVSIDTANKDSIIKAVKYWLIELGEVDATVRKSDIASLKAFTTEEYDEIRLPYAKAAQVSKRQTSMMASVNDTEFLADESSRRFWVMPIEWVNVDHAIDIAQLWAEAKHLFDNKEPFWLSPEELAIVNRDNLKYAKGSAVTDRLSTAKLSHTHSSYSKDRMTTTELLEKIGMKNISKADRGECMRWLKQNDFKFYTKGSLWAVAVDNIPDALVEAGSFQGCGMA